MQASLKVLLLLSCLAACSAAASETGVNRPPTYELKLVYIFESSEPKFVFVIGNSGFTSVATLEKFIASLRPGTTLQWDPGCVRLGGEPLLSSAGEMERFKDFCRKHRVNLVLRPSG